MDILFGQHLKFTQFAPPLSIIHVKLWKTTNNQKDLIHTSVELKDKKDVLAKVLPGTKPQPTAEILAFIKASEEMLVKQRNQRILFGCSFLFVIGLVIGILGMVTLYARSRQLAEAEIARAGELAATAITLNDTPLLSLLSIEAFKTTDKWQTRNAIYIANNKNPNLLQHIYGDFLTNAISFSPDGKLLASPSINNTILFIDVDPSSPQYGHVIGETSAQHKDFISYVVFSPNGKLLASSSGDTTIILWDADRSSPTFGEPLITPLQVHTDVVWKIAFSPDGKIMASCSEDKSALIWDADPLSQTFGKVIASPLIGHTAGIRAVAISSKKVIATGGDNIGIVFWDGDPLSPTFGHAISSPLQYEGGPINYIESLAFNPDGKVLASAGRVAAVFLWYADPSSPLFGQVFKEPLVGETSGPIQIKFNPKSETLASIHWDKSTRIWNVSQTSSDYGQLINSPMVGDGETVLALDISPNGNYLATGSTDGVIRIWNAVPSPQDFGKPLFIFQPEIPINGFDFFSDGSLMASGSGNSDNRIYILDTDLYSSSFGQPISPPFLGPETASTYDVDLSPDNKYLAAANGTHHSVQIWNVDRTSPEFGKPFGNLFGSVGDYYHTHYVTVVDYSPDGRILASGSHDTTIILWDADVSSPRFGQAVVPPLEGHRGFIEDLQFSPDGKILASSDYEYTIRVWNVDPNTPSFGESLCQPMKSDHELVDNIAFSTDGKVLASGDAGGTIYLWSVDPESNNFCEPIGPPFAGNARISDIVFSTDGKNLITVDFNEAIMYWDIDPSSPTFGDPIGPPLLTSQDGPKSSARLEMYPGSKILVSKSASGLIFWDANIESWIANICQRAGRNLTEKEWSEYLAWKGPFNPEYKTCPLWPSGRR